VDNFVAAKNALTGSSNILVFLTYQLMNLKVRKVAIKTSFCELRKAGSSLDFVSLS
jgi:hypothetical protein